MDEMEKVKVSQEVANAADILTTNDTLAEVFNWVTADYEVCDSDIRILKEWNSERDDEGEGLMKLLIGYYEVDRTPAEILKDYFDSVSDYDINPIGEKIIDNIPSTEQQAILKTLEILNIKIAGVNV